MTEASTLVSSTLSTIKDKEVVIMFINLEKFTLAAGKKMPYLKALIYSEMGKVLRVLRKMESKDLEYTIMLMETFITDIGKMI